MNKISELRERVIVEDYEFIGIAETWATESVNDAELSMEGYNMFRKGPWVSLFRRAESVEFSYEALVNILSAKDRLELVANVNRAFNRDVMEITSSVKTVFEALEYSGTALGL